MAAQGNPDPSFGEGGGVLTEFFPGKSAQELNALIIQRDPVTKSDKIVAAGSVAALIDQEISSTGLIHSGFGLIRYNLDGSPDSTFGVSGNGIVITNFSTFRLEPPNLISRGEVVHDLAIDRAGRLVAAGTCYFDDGQSHRIALARYNSDGTPDTRFGNHGRVLTNINTSSDMAMAVAIQTWRDPRRRGFRHFPWPDYPFVSRIVVGAVTNEPGTPPTASRGAFFTLLRYELDGTLDEGFGTRGISRAPHFTRQVGHVVEESGFDRLADLVVQSDGKLVAVGTADFGFGGHFIGLARSSRDGSLDTSFAGTGQLVVKVPDSGTDGQAHPRAVRVQSDGKIVIAGGTAGASSSDQRLVLARFNPDGTLDTGFGDAGFVLPNVSIRPVRGGRGAEGANALVIDPDGNLVVAGTAESRDAQARNAEFLVARFNADGSPDEEFGDGGIVRSSIPLNPGPFGLPANASANALALQPDGRIVAAGDVFLGSAVPAQTWALVRYR